MIQDMTNKVHEIIISWLSFNKLHLNANKSTFITIHTNQEQCTLNKHVMTDSTNVYQSCTNNFLCIIYDETIPRLPHIHFMSIKNAKTIGILRRLTKYVIAKILLITYNILILLYLTYCCIIWGYAYPSHLIKIYLAKKPRRILISAQHKQHIYKIF